MLTKEELLKIKLPLSDDDYVKLHEEMPKLGFTLRSVSKELNEAYFSKMCEIFDEVFLDNECPPEKVKWYPPQTKKYWNHPQNVEFRKKIEFNKHLCQIVYDIVSRYPIDGVHSDRKKQGAQDLDQPFDSIEPRSEEEEMISKQAWKEFLKEKLREYGLQPNPPFWLEWPPENQLWPPKWLVLEKMQQIKLPLSDEDYVMIHDIGWKHGIFPSQISCELDDAFDQKMWAIYDEMYPDNNLAPEEVPWYPPQTEEFKDHPKNISIRKSRERIERYEKYGIWEEN